MNRHEPVGERYRYRRNRINGNGWIVEVDRGGTGSGHSQQEKHGEQADNAHCRTGEGSGKEELHEQQAENSGHTKTIRQKPGVRNPPA